MHAFDVLGDPVRRRILELLGADELTSGALCAVIQREFGISQPAVSQHLKVLKEAGLVRDVREGTRRVYSLDPVGIGGLRDYLDRFWNTALHSFKARVELVQHEAQQQSQQEDIP